MVDWLRVATVFWRIHDRTFDMAKHGRGYAITAVDDAGNKHILHVVPRFITSPRSNPPVTTQVSGKILTNRGDQVMRINKGHYLTINGIDLRSDDPNAP
jgi:hypothetical protein